jgi:hypothetical protein
MRTSGRRVHVKLRASMEEQDENDMHAGVREWTYIHYNAVGLLQSHLSLECRARMNRLRGNYF